MYENAFKIPWILEGPEYQVDWLAVFDPTESKKASFRRDPTLNQLLLQPISKTALFINIFSTRSPRTY